MTLETLILLAAFLHFALLPVSLAVPRIFDWKKEMAGLSPMTRKIIWVHGAFISGIIVAFGILTFLEAGPLAAGERPALAALMGIFWLARLVVQFLYYKPKEWPKGGIYLAGRYGLTALFTFWSAVYLAALATGLGL